VSLRQQFGHRVGGSLPRTGYQVPVNLGRHRGVLVAQVGADDDQRDTGTEEPARGGVPQIVNPDRLGQDALSGSSGSTAFALASDFVHTFD
jgi:hypothetical protein